MSRCCLPVKTQNLYLCGEGSQRLKKQTLQNLTWKNSEKSLIVHYLSFNPYLGVFYSFWQWPKCLKKKNLLRKFSKIWYCLEVLFQVWKSGLSRNFLAKVKSDPKFNKSYWKIIHLIAIPSISGHQYDFFDTGYSFWDRLRNFLHKFTWIVHRERRIVLSVHKLNKLGKFW